MSYLTRLREKLNENRYPEVLTNLTEPSFGSFDGLPSQVLRGLNILRVRAPPDISTPSIWPEVVSDALRLADEGWAQRALNLGWSPLDLWGASPEIGGNFDQEGLAIWLARRRIVLLDETSCIVESGPGGRLAFNRSALIGAVLLWDVGGEGQR